MKLKAGVKSTGSDQGLCLGLMAANDAFKLFGFGMIITSLNDGTHGLTSLHYAGAAADLRTKHVEDTQTKKDILAEIKASLTVDYDVLLEHLGGENEHIHMEYQPRRRASA